MIKKKQFIRKAVSLSLSFATILSPISVMAAADGPGSLTFDCGEGATTCPSRIDFSSNGGSLWKDTVGEKPIPTKPGSQFVDWELVSGNGDVVKPGDFFSQWDTYTVGDINGYGGGDVVVKAVWNSGKESTVPITISIPSTPINVTLPSSIEISFPGDDVNGIIASNFTIINNSKARLLELKSIKANIKDNDWKLTSEASEEYYQVLAFNSKELYLAIKVKPEVTTSQKIPCCVYTCGNRTCGKNGTSCCYDGPCKSCYETVVVSPRVLQALNSEPYFFLKNDYNSWYMYPDTDNPLYSNEFQLSFEAKTGGVSSAVSGQDLVDIILTFKN